MGSRACYFVLILVCSLSLVACETEPGEGFDGDAPTYYADAKPILDARCVTCHALGDIAPFVLDDYQQAFEARGAIAASVEAGTMPPWPPADDCQSYEHDRSLTGAERDLLLAWVEAGAPEGDPSDAPPDSSGDSEEREMRVDLTLQLDEPYVPQSSPDDYRCMVVEWPEDETRFITGFEVVPDRREMVHHVIAFSANAAAADTYRALDAEEEGQGYTCYGGPGGNGAGLGSGVRWVASWAPGPAGRVFTEGTGIEVEPGSVIILQMHYNTLTVEPMADQSRIELMLESEVERPATVMPFTDIGWVLGTDPMTIPPHEADVVHSTSRDIAATALDYRAASIGLSDGDDFVVHATGLHMHQLGTQIRTWLQRADGSVECLLDIPAWDFGWQGAYSLSEPVTVRAGDRMFLECHWDNTVENQVIIDGDPLPPREVSWGDQTTDEMCLAIYYITGA
ncbi:MAG: monooxygenase [Myxococcota bacterium]|nr:monooxygenase [Myxococcota bacterium]